MIGSKAIIDSSILIEVIKGNRDIFEKLYAIDKVYINPIILSELYFGAYRSANPTKNVNQIRAAVQRFQIIIIDADTAQHFVSVKLDLFARGTPISENDNLDCSFGNAASICRLYKR